MTLNRMRAVAAARGAAEGGPDDRAAMAPLAEAAALNNDAELEAVAPARGSATELALL